MITNKLKSVLALKGLTFADYARKLGIMPQSLQTKSQKNAYKIKDLIEFCDLTETKLAVVDYNNKVVVEFSKEDLLEKKG